MFDLTFGIALLDFFRLDFCFGILLLAMRFCVVPFCKGFSSTKWGLLSISLPFPVVGGSSVPHSPLFLQPPIVARFPQTLSIALPVRSHPHSRRSDSPSQLFGSPLPTCLSRCPVSLHFPKARQVPHFQPGVIRLLAPPLRCSPLPQLHFPSPDPVTSRVFQILLCRADFGSPGFSHFLLLWSPLVDTLAPSWPAAHFLVCS